jgi:hypothetical protein
METALDIVTIAGGFGAAWLTHRELDPWRNRAGGAPYRRAQRIYAVAIVGAFFGGGLLTQLILLWLG